VKVGDLVRKKQPSKFKGYGIIVREGSSPCVVVVWSDGGPPLHTTKRSLLPLV
jgi:hypothetical protein